MRPPTYDTHEGITASLVSLAAFNTVCRERKEAGYVRHERLTDFIVLGRYWLDCCGNCGIMEKTEPDMPPVVTREELRRLSLSGSCWTVALRRLPEGEDTCRECGEHWHLGNAHDSLHRITDEGSFFLHARCASARIAREQRAYFMGALVDAGFEHPCLVELPNGYREYPGAPPWFRAYTEVGTVVLGWRKRVVNVDWSEISRLDLFDGSEDTHGPGYRHVWTRDALVTVLVEVRRALRVGTPTPRTGSEQT